MLVPFLIVLERLLGADDEQAVSRSRAVSGCLVFRLLYDLKLG